MQVFQTKTYLSMVYLLTPLGLKASTTRNVGVCLYFKESLPIKERRDLETIPETIVAEIKGNRKKLFMVLSFELIGIVTNAYVKKILLYVLFVEISTQGLRYFRKVIRDRKWSFI